MPKTLPFYWLALLFLRTASHDRHSPYFCQPPEFVLSQPTFFFVTLQTVKSRGYFRHSEALKADVIPSAYASVMPSALRPHAENSPALHRHLFRVTKTKKTLAGGQISGNILGHCSHNFRNKRGYMAKAKKAGEKQGNGAKLGFEAKLRKR